MGRAIAAAVVGAIILFMWGYVSWTVLPWHETSGFQLDPPNEAAIVASLQANVVEDGLYWIPGEPEDMTEAGAFEAFKERYEKGPFAILIYKGGGAEYMPPMTFARGFGLYFVASLLAALLLSLTNVRSYFVRLMFVTGLGVFVAVVGDLEQWNWMNFPTDWCTVNAADHIVAWFLAGLAIAGISKSGGVDTAAD